MKAPAWSEVWAEAKERHPDLAGPEAEARRVASREKLVARIRGHERAELRRSAGLTQKKVARTLGVSRARVSQIEHGQVDSLESLRAYAAVLGAEVSVVVQRGPVTVEVA